MDGWMNGLMRVCVCMYIYIYMCVCIHTYVFGECVYARALRAQLLQLIPRLERQRNPRTLKPTNLGSPVVPWCVFFFGSL